MLALKPTSILACRESFGSDRAIFPAWRAVHPQHAPKSNILTLASSDIHGWMGIARSTHPAGLFVTVHGQSPNR